MIGEHSPKAKLSKADVLELRDIASKSKINYSAQGRRLGVSYQTIRDAVLGATHRYEKLEAVS
jgi:capsid protein